MQSKTVTGRDVHHVAQILDVDKLKWRPGAYGLAFNDAGEILVVKNTLNNRYEFPGGGVEIHESFDDALVREVWEETGLTVQIESFILFDDEFFLTPSGRHWHTIKCFYQCTVVDGELRRTILDEEPLEYPEWIDPAILSKDTLTMGWEALQQVKVGK